MTKGRFFMASVNSEGVKARERRWSTDLGLGAIGSEVRSHEMPWEALGSHRKGIGSHRKHEMPHEMCHIADRFVGRISSVGSLHSMRFGEATWFNDGSNEINESDSSPTSYHTTQGLEWDLTQRQCSSAT